MESKSSILLQAKENLATGNLLDSENCQSEKEIYSERSSITDAVAHKHELRRFFINRQEFFQFHNKIENCKVLFMKKDFLKNNTKDDVLVEKTSFEDTFDMIKCCICFENKNNIILSCTVNIDINKKYLIFYIFF